MATIKIKNLRLQAIIGINNDERINQQDIIINASIEFDDSKAAETDNISDTVDYKNIAKNIIRHVEQSSYFLLETLTSRICDICTADPRVTAATVEVDKPHSVRFADSVSVTKTVKRL
ncbi:MAG: dihydroneopterin aldolase [Candidatus Auribacterota bacterium]